jgi:hypothetical protein
MNGGTKAGLSTKSLEWLNCARRDFRRPHRKKKKKQKQKKGNREVVLV